VGFFAAVEADTGDSIRVTHPDSAVGGNAIVTFLAALSQYCAKSEAPADIRAWFSELEGRMEEPICLLSQVVYSGEWDYLEDEYREFLQRSPQMQLTEAQFRETTRRIGQTWADAQALLSSVSELARVLAETDTKPTWWYEPGVTETDLQALSEALSLAADRGAQKARVKFI